MIRTRKKAKQKAMKVEKAPKAAPVKKKKAAPAKKRASSAKKKEE
tara:strand:+ start:494 stop:628 length:135 start_codon:yes stop_codon:yes gene_type:complete